MICLCLGQVGLHRVTGSYLLSIILRMTKRQPVKKKWENGCIQNSLQIHGNVGRMKIYWTNILKRKLNGGKENIEESECRTGQQSLASNFRTRPQHRLFETVSLWKGRNFAKICKLTGPQDSYMGDQAVVQLVMHFRCKRGSKLGYKKTWA